MMADDDWREQGRGHGRAGRYRGRRDSWPQDDAPQFDRWDRDYPRLGYGPYARRETAGMSRSSRQDTDFDRYGRSRHGQSRYDRESRGESDDYGRSRHDRDDYWSGGSSRYSSAYRRGYDHDDDRDWMDRAGDEVASWFGDDDAEARRRMDRRRDEIDRYYRRNDDYLSSGRSRRRWRDDW